MKPRNFGRAFAQGADRGTRRGARWVFVTPTLEMIEYAKDTKRPEWILFRSRKEAKRWIGLCVLKQAGLVRNLARQVRYDLTTTTPDGLKEIVTRYVADFVYTEFGKRIVEDVKPTGGLREDIYLLKKKWMQIEHGIEILET